MHTVYIVRCFMEGCEECSNEFHIIGAFSTQLKAKEAEEHHNKKYEHLHYFFTNIDNIEIDKYYLSYNEKPIINKEVNNETR